MYVTDMTEKWFKGDAQNIDDAIYIRHVNHYGDIVVHYDCVPVGVPMWKARVYFPDNKEANYAAQLALIDLAFAMGSSSCNLSPLGVLQLARARAIARTSTDGDKLYTHKWVKVYRDHTTGTAMVRSHLGALCDDEAKGLATLQWWISTALETAKFVTSGNGAFPWIE